MAEKAKIVIVTGSRSEWGLLSPLVDEIRNHFLVRIVAIGSHLSEQFGHTLDLVPFNYSYETLLDSDSPAGVSKSMALTLLSLADKWSVNFDRPDCVLVLGDRFETLAASIAAYNQGIKIAHIEGDDVTLGSLDEGYRKSIRSMASIHFDVAEYGSLGCVFPKMIEPTRKIDVMVVFHPHKGDWETELDAIIRYFEQTPFGERFLFIGSNSDSGGRKILDKYDEKGICYENLDRTTYISLLKKVKYVIGNSSSGIIETPSLGVSSINVGHRQDGRTKAASVIDCEGTLNGIKEAVEKTKHINWGRIKNYYYKPDTIKRIVQTLQARLG